MLLSKGSFKEPPTLTTSILFLISLDCSVPEEEQTVSPEE